LDEAAARQPRFAPRSWLIARSRRADPVASTITTYLDCARRFAEHYERSPGALGAPEIRAFLLYLLRERKVAPSSFNVYAAAIRFLYTVTLDRPEVIALSSSFESHTGPRADTRALADRSRGTPQ